MSKYRINFKSIMKNLSFSIFVIVAFTLTYFYFEYIKGESIALWIILLIVLGQLIPVIILLIDYYVNSTGDEILVRNEHMEVKKGSDVVIINKEEIQKSTIYAAPSWNRNSTVQFFPFEPFHFVEIKLKTGKTVYITSLSDHNLYKNIQKEKVFKGIIYLNKGGLSRNGNLINSIFWKKLD